MTVDFLAFPPRARTLLVIRYGLVAALFALLAAGPAVAIAMAASVGGAVAFWVVAVLAAFVAAWWWSGMVYRCRTWRRTEGTVELRNGVIWKRHAVLPRNRVQNVTINSGPIRRHFDVATVVVHSAGAATPNIKLEGFAATTGDALQADLLAHGVPATIPAASAPAAPPMS